MGLRNRESVENAEKGRKEFDFHSFLFFNTLSRRGMPSKRTQVIGPGTQFDQLLKAARGGDQSALGHLLDSFRAYLTLLADRKLGMDLKPKCSRSDLVQRTFLDAQKVFGQFDGSNPPKLLAWLERILLNNLGDVARQFRQTEKRQIQREVQLAESWGEISALIDRSTPSKKVSAQEETDRLRLALARLPEDYQQIIALRSLERRKFEEIANTMGRSVGAVKKLWSRAIVLLKDEMKVHERP
jgi:RNA polymerase sigma-70 factor (ECF subfamily)